MNVRLLIAILAMVLFSSTLYAQTPDGETPANEGVCDVLRADGTTKGLYGLCVAFCEAQDYVDVNMPITEEELDAILKSAPSGKILLNYNRRKADSDPEMPCIMVEESCPCWTAEELASIDGILWDGTVANLTCNYGPRLVVQKMELSDDGGDYQRVQASTRYCRYQFREDDIFVDTTLVVDRGTLTQEQADACFAAAYDSCDW